MGGDDLSGSVCDIEVRWISKKIKLFKKLLLFSISILIQFDPFAIDHNFCNAIL
jgi:hypothetical protein